MATERRVNGLKVVETEPVETPLSGHTPGGPDKRVYYKSIIKLLLEDGSEVYGCTVEGCGHFEETPNGARYHTMRDHPKPDAKKPGPKPAIKESKKAPAEKLEPVERTRPEPEPTSVMDMTVAELLTVATEVVQLRKDLGKMTASRDEWRDKAREYKKDLDRIRKVIGQ